MEIKIIVFAFASFLHNLFTVIWMGGLILTVIGFLPALKETFGVGPEVKKAMQAFQNRQRRWTLISIGGLVLTGIMMSQRSAQFSAFFSFANPYSTGLTLKHLLVLIMIALSVYRGFFLQKTKQHSVLALEKTSRLILIVNALLAVFVLLISGFVSAVS